MLKGWVVFTFFSLKTANPFCYRCAEKDARYRTCLAESHGVIWKRCEGTSLCELASSDEEMNATRCLDDDDGRQYDKYIYMEYRCDDPGIVCNIASRDGHLENRFRRIRICWGSNPSRSFEIRMDQNPFQDQDCKYLNEFFPDPLSTRFIFLLNVVFPSGKKIRIRIRIWKKYSRTFQNSQLFYFARL